MECIRITLPEITSLPDYKKIRNESGTEDLYYSVTYKGIPAEFKTLAEKELNENEEKKMKGIRKLREFIKKEKLTEVDENILIMVLRNSKYNLKKAETKLQKYLKARETILSRLEEVDLKKVEMIIEDCGIGILPFRDKHGRLIIFTRPEGMNDDLYSFDNVLLVGVATVMLFMSYPLTTIAGIAYIGDGRFKTTASYVKLLKSYKQYIWTFLELPVGLKRVEIPYEHFLAKWFYNIVRPFLSNKIASRVTFHGTNLEKLKNMYHPDILPEEFGGNMGPLDLTFCRDLAVDFIRKIKAENQAMKESAKQEK